MRLVALIAAMTLVACGLTMEASAADDVAAHLQHVTLQLKWSDQFQFAGYYTALAKGFYRKAGLDVTIVSGRPGMDPIQQVVQGRADFGVGTTDLLLLRDKGVPVVVLADIFQHSPVALMVRKDSGIWNIHQLAEGRLMIEPNSAELYAYLTDEGIAIDRLHLVQHDFSVDKLVDRQVDAMSVYITDEPFDMKQLGIPYLLFRPIESGIDFYGDNLFTMQSEITRHPRLVQGFVQASIDGWQYAMAHPSEIVDLILSDYHTTRSRASLLFEADQMQPLIDANIVHVGYINPGRWSRIAQKYADLGMIKPNLDLSGFIYDPNRKPDFTFLYRLFAVLAAVALALAALVLWYRRLNGRLQHEVEVRSRAQAELERLDGQKALLLSIIGHDLRAPFNVLLNYGDLLVSQGTGLDKRRLASIFQSVRDAAASAYTLLNNLLDWATLQTERGHVSAETVEITGLVDGVVDLLTPLATAKNIELRVAPLAGLTVHADRRMIETVLRNLVSNALKYTKPGGVVAISAYAEGEQTRIEIADDGIGMAPERLERLFELEAKRPVPGTNHEPGSGIGLILCRDLVSANGGSLSVASELGVGTTVTLLLPARQEADQASFSVSRSVSQVATEARAGER